MRLWARSARLIVIRVRDESRTRTATGIPLASVVETLARRRVGPAEGHTGRMAARVVARQFSRGHPIVTLMLELSRCDRRIESRTVGAVLSAAPVVGAAAALAPSAEGPSAGASCDATGVRGRLRTERVVLTALMLAAGLVAVTRQPTSWPASPACRT